MTQHTWRLTARDAHSSRYRCSSCGVIKTVVSMGDQFPRTRYRLLDERVLERAPNCKGEAA